MKKIMCFGTFDKLHLGHISYLKQAKKYGDYIIVVVARDKNSEKLKGRKPTENEKVRLRNTMKLKIVHKAVLGQERDRMTVIRKYKPDVICLGYDQGVNMKMLMEIFNGKILRMKPYKEDIYKTSLLINPKYKITNHKQ